MSDKSVAERLQLKGDRRIAVLAAPPALDQAIGVLDRRVELRAADVVLVAVPDQAALEAAIAATLAGLSPKTLMWVAYPKLTSPLARDLSRDRIRGLALSAGLDTVSQIAIDADWSALRLKRL